MKKHNDIAAAVVDTLERYFNDLDGEQPTDVYNMVMRNTERPLLQCIMARTNGNQSEAAQLLGINRNTLRRKLLDHGLVDSNF